MVRSRVSASLLAALFLIHLVVVGSSFAAGMDGSGGMTDMDVVVSMNAPGEQVPSPRSERMPCPEGAPCQLPVMPPGCLSALPCGSAPSLPGRPAAVELVAGSLASAEVPATRLPPTRVFPPELPPPRA